MASLSFINAFEHPMQQVAMKPTLILTFLLLISTVSRAQEVQSPVGHGVVRLYGWPASTGSVASEKTTVKIDSLSLGYGYRVAEGRPYLTFGLEWVSPDTTARIEAITLGADVHADAVIAGRLLVPLSDLALASYPDLLRFELLDLEWVDVFEGISAEKAQELFADGFELADLRIEEIRFEGDPPVQKEVADSRSRRERHGSRQRTIYEPSVDIFIDIPLWHRPMSKSVTENRGRTEAPRGDTVGRGTEDRRETRGERTENVDQDTGSRSDARGNEAQTDDNDEAEAGGATRKRRKKSDDEDDEDDDAELLPAALVGVAAVAAIAVAGGTVGYYGNTKHAPIGLTAGMVLEDGGVMLQVGVNQAVLDKSDVTSERFIGRVISFYDLFSAPVKPALGLGAMVTEIGGDYEYELSVSPGLVGVLGPVILIGGYDVISGGVDMGVAFNFKHRRH